MTKPKSLWLIDDEEIQDLFLKAMIKSQPGPINYSYFSNASAALDELKNKRKAEIIVFLDIFMQGLNGFDFLEIYNQSGHESRCKLHVYMLTSSELETDKATCKTYPFVKGYIVKPLVSAHFNELLNHFDRPGELF